MKLKKILFQGQFSLIYNLAKFDFEFCPFESSLSYWRSTLDLSLATDPFKRMVRKPKKWESIKVQFENEFKTRFQKNRFWFVTSDGHWR